MSAHAPSKTEAKASAKGGALGKAKLWWQCKGKAARAGLVASLLALMTSATLGLWLLGGPTRTLIPASAKRALALLEAGNLGGAKATAERVVARGSLSKSERATAEYVLGAIASHEAEALWDDDRVRKAKAAAEHLETARDVGFPEECKVKGAELLGQNLFESRQYAASVPVLEAALETSPDQATRLHRWLSVARLNLSPPDLQGALKHNAALLADDSLSADDRQEAVLQAARIQFAQGERANCRQSLSQILPASKLYGQAMLLTARLLMQDAADAHDATERQEKRQAAVEALKLAKARLPHDAQTGAAATYLMGVCYRDLDEVRKALDEFGRTIRSYPDTPEAQAAGLALAEMLSKLDRRKEAVSAYRKAIESAVKAAEQDNPWLPAAELRERALAVQRAWLNQQDYQHGLQLTELLKQILPPAQQSLLAAEARKAWAQSLTAEAAKAGGDEAKALTLLADEQWQAAGREYARLAELRFATREFTEDLWESADCFWLGHDFQSSIAPLEAYLTHEFQKQRSIVLLRLGESLLALGRTRDALARFSEAVAFDPYNAATYRARLLAAQANVQLAQTEPARKLLLANIQSDLLTPASPEWRDSLFTLGELLHLDGQYAEALVRLEEAVKRYPAAPQAVKSRYLMADCYRLLAKRSQQELERSVVESARQAHAKQRQRELEAAIDQYDAAIGVLNGAGDAAPLAPLAESILRNCHFFKGASLFELGRYDQAIKAYSMAINRYQSVPESLEAYVQIGDCYRRLNRPLEAKSAVEQAKAALARMNADAPFAAVTNRTREEWEQHLAWLSSL